MLTNIIHVLSCLVLSVLCVSLSPLSLSPCPPLSKSCLVDRFLHDRWLGGVGGPGVAPTVGAAFGARTIPIGSGSADVTIGVWDTAGSERYESMTRHYYKGSEGALICYDLTDSESFDKCKYWVDEISKSIDINDCILTIVGCKADEINQNNKKRGVPKDVILNYCSSINARHYETSALSGHGVVQPFTEIAQQWALKPKKTNNNKNQQSILQSEEQQKGEKGGCC